MSDHEEGQPGATGGDSPASGPPPVRSGLFRTDPPALLGGGCASCGQAHFPLGPACPYCSSVEVTETVLPTQGRLWAWTAVTAPPPGSIGAVPYGFGVVELVGGPRVVTRLTESDPGKLRRGQAMRLVLVELREANEAEDPVLTYAFAAFDELEAGVDE